MGRYTLGLILLCVGLIFAAPGRADFQGGVAEYKNKHYQEAYAQLLPLADAGDPLAQYYIGQIYYWGRGHETDEEKGIQYLHAASDQGLAQAQHSLGTHYKNSFLDGSDPDGSERAYVLHLKAATQGYPPAYLGLSLLYCTGLGVPKMEYVASAWYILYLEADGEQPLEALLTNNFVVVGCDDNWPYNGLGPTIATILAEKIRQVHDLPSPEESRARFGD